jgi:hypothetical protein
VSRPADGPNPTTKCRVDALPTGRKSAPGYEWHFIDGPVPIHLLCAPGEDLIHTLARVRESRSSVGVERRRTQMADGTDLGVSEARVEDAQAAVERSMSSPSWAVRGVGTESDGQSPFRCYSPTGTGSGSATRVLSRGLVRLMVA